MAAESLQVEGWKNLGRPFEPFEPFEADAFVDVLDILEKRPIEELYGTSREVSFLFRICGTVERRIC